MDPSGVEIDISDELALRRYDFVLEALIGCGGFGRVYRCRCLKSGAVVAIKVLSKADARRLGMQARVISEVAVHSSLNHDNVAKLLDFFEDARRIFLVLECANGGDVFRIVSRLGRFSLGAARHFTRQLLCALRYLHDDANVMHRDLKLSNLLLYENGSIDGVIRQEKAKNESGVVEDEEEEVEIIDEDEEVAIKELFGNNLLCAPSSNSLKRRSWYRSFTLRICDFGLAVKTKLDNNNDSNHSQSGTKGQENLLFREHRTICGTPAYIAPEIAALVNSSAEGDAGQSGSSGVKGYGTGVDVFSAGCLLYCMCFGQPPAIVVSSPSSLQNQSSSTNNPNAETAGATASAAVVVGVHSVLSPDYEKNLATLPIEAAEAIRLLMMVDVSSRPTAAQALELPFFSSKSRFQERKIVNMATPPFNFNRTTSDASAVPVLSLSHSVADNDISVIPIKTSRKNIKKNLGGKLLRQSTSNSSKITTSLVEVSPIRTTRNISSSSLTKSTTANVDTETEAAVAANAAANELVIAAAHVSARTNAAAAMEILTQETLAHESVSIVLNRTGDHLINTSKFVGAVEPVLSIKMTTDDYMTNARVPTSLSSPLSECQTPHSPPCLIRKTAEEDAANFFRLSMFRSPDALSPNLEGEKVNIPTTPPPLIRSMRNIKPGSPSSSMKDHNGEFSASGALELKQTPPNVTHLENQEMPSLPSRWAIHPTPSSTSATNITTAAGQRDHLDGKNSKMPLFASHSSVWTTKARAPPSSNIESVSAPVSAYMQETETKNSQFPISNASNSLSLPSQLSHPILTISVGDEREECVKSVYPERSRAFNPPSSPTELISSARELALPSPLPTPTTAAARAKLQHPDYHVSGALTKILSSVAVEADDVERRKAEKAALIAKLNEKSIHVPAIIIPRMWDLEAHSIAQGAQNSLNDSLYVETKPTVSQSFESSQEIVAPIESSIIMQHKQEMNSTSNVEINTVIDESMIIRPLQQPVESATNVLVSDSTTPAIISTESNVEETQSSFLPLSSKPTLNENPFAWAQKEFNILQHKQKIERDSAAKAAAISAAAEKSRRDSSKKLLERIQSRDDAGAAAVLSALGHPRKSLRSSSTTSQNNSRSSITMLSLTRDTSSFAMTAGGGGGGGGSKYSGSGSGTTMSILTSSAVEAVSNSVNTGLSSSSTANQHSDTLCSMNGGANSSQEDARQTHSENDHDKRNMSAVDDSRSYMSMTSEINHNNKTSQDGENNHTSFDGKKYLNISRSSSDDVAEADISQLSASTATMSVPSQNSNITNPNNELDSSNSANTSITFPLSSFFSSSSSSLSISNVFLNTTRLKSTTVRCRSSPLESSQLTQVSPIIMKIQNDGNLLLTTANKVSIRISRLLQTVTVAASDRLDQGVLKSILHLAHASIQVLRARTQKIVLLSSDCLAALMEDGPRPTFELHVRSLVSNKSGSPTDNGSWHLQYRLRDQRLLVTSPKGKSFGCVVSNSPNHQPLSSSLKTTFASSLSTSLTVACRAADLPPHILALYSIAIRLLARCIAIDAHGSSDSLDQINALKSSSALLHRTNGLDNNDATTTQDHEDEDAEPREASSFASWSKMSQVSSASQMAQRIDESMKRRGDNKAPPQSLLLTTQLPQAQLNASFSTSSSASSTFSMRSRRSETAVDTAIRNGQDPYPVVVKEPNARWIDVGTARMLILVEEGEEKDAADTQKISDSCVTNSSKGSAHSGQDTQSSGPLNSSPQSSSSLSSAPTALLSVSNVSQSPDGGLRVTFSDKVILLISADGRDVSVNNEEANEALQTQSIIGSNESLVSTGSLTGSSGVRLPRHVKTRLLIARDYLRSESAATTR
jgi:serine/threonine protein kinase